MSNQGCKWPLPCIVSTIALLHEAMANMISQTLITRHAHVETISPKEDITPITGLDKTWPIQGKTIFHSHWFIQNMWTLSYVVTLLNSIPSFEKYTVQNFQPRTYIHFKNTCHDEMDDVLHLSILNSQHNQHGLCKCLHINKAFILSSTLTTFAFQICLWNLIWQYPWLANGKQWRKWWIQSNGNCLSSCKCT